MIVSEGGECEVGTRNVAAKVIPLRNNFFLWRLFDVSGLNE